MFRLFSSAESPRLDLGRSLPTFLGFLSLRLKWSRAFSPSLKQWVGPGVLLEWLLPLRLV
jgi:hypothetical protein